MKYTRRTTEKCGLIKHLKPRDECLSLEACPFPVKASAGLSRREVLTLKERVRQASPKVKHLMLKTYSEAKKIETSERGAIEVGGARKK